MTHFRTCPLCEALCGLEITLDPSGGITRIRGDHEDVLSGGHVCPKGVALQDLQRDPDRLRRPVRRTASGWEPLSWEDALDLAATGLDRVAREHGRRSLGVYLGNPNVHHYDSLLSLAVLGEVLRTPNRFSATSADQLPHMFSALHLFGHQLLLPVPDLDRTHLLLVVGANPWASNGSLMTAGDVRRRVGAIRARGGRVVVLDPRRTETADAADAHWFVRPGTDALALLAMLHVLFAEDLVDDGPWRAWTRDLDRLAAVAARFPPERVAARVGVEADALRGLARDLAAAPSAAVYARFGACTQAFGGLTAWLAHALALVTGNLDRPGGLMFTTPAVDLVGLTARLGQRGSYDRWRSRVSGLPEFGGELPVAALAEELETPGERQIRGLLTVAGNPVLSTPGGHRLDALLPGLSFMVSIDPYLNETTRHAHVILPPAAPLSRTQCGLAMQALAVRNVLKVAPPLLPDPDARDDGALVLGLAARYARASGQRRAAVALAGLGRLGLERVLDVLLRVGPHGAGLLGLGPGLTLARALARPHGIDLGPLQPQLPERLHTEDRRVHAAPEPLVRDVARLEATLDAPVPDLVLIGRRQLRSNNSWLHNSPRLVKGAARCTLLLHPADAASRGLADGDLARLGSSVGQVEVPVELSDAMMPGVVSLPHGWGHHRDGVRLAVARAHAGVSANDVTDPALVDRLTGTAAFSGVPVTVERVHAEG